MHAGSSAAAARMIRHRLRTLPLNVGLNGPLGVGRSSSSHPHGRWVLTPILVTEIDTDGLSDAVDVSAGYGPPKCKPGRQVGRCDLLTWALMTD